MKPNNALQAIGARWRLSLRADVRPNRIRPPKQRNKGIEMNRYLLCVASALTSAMLLLAGCATTFRSGEVLPIPKVQGGRVLVSGSGDDIRFAITVCDLVSQKGLVPIIDRKATEWAITRALFQQECWATPSSTVIEQNRIYKRAVQRLIQAKDPFVQKLEEAVQTGTFDSRYALSSSPPADIDVVLRVRSSRQGQSYRKKASWASQNSTLDWAGASAIAISCSYRGSVLWRRAIRPIFPTFLDSLESPDMIVRGKLIEMIDSLSVHEEPP